MNLDPLQIEMDFVFGLSGVPALVDRINEIKLLSDFLIFLVFAYSIILLRSLLLKVFSAVLLKFLLQILLRLPFLQIRGRLNDQLLLLRFRPVQLDDFPIAAFLVVVRFV